jgi:3',5'-cyclic AMP phosphodiesterase CpdA
MTKYRLKVAGLITLIIFISCTNPNDGPKVSHLINNQWEFSSTIAIPDFKDSLKILQITDSHISIEDEKEADLMKYGERMHKAYMVPFKHYLQDIYKTTFEYFDELLLKAKNEDVELLLLTGDIVNFPSAVSAKYVYDRLVETGIPWLYIAGNHDWYYEGMPGSQDSLRLTWIEKNLAPLYKGHNPLYYSEIINGINFVGIDNSTYRISDEQVQFMEEQLSGHEPVILISHIPYSLNRNASQPGTTALVDLILANTDKIIAILTGHTHRISYYFTGNLCQYTSLAACQGGSLTVSIKSKETGIP